MKDPKLRGVFAPVTTPFSAGGEVDYKGLEENMRVYAQSGIKGYLALGSNGENKSLTDKEKLSVLEVIVKNKGADQTVMAGCIFESTRETVEMAKSLESVGPDFLTLLPPSYFKSMMTDDALLKYFTDVADAVQTPCLVYNAPQFCGGLSLSVSLIKKLAEHPNIRGIKDSSTGSIESILFAVGDDFSVMAGSANFFFTALLLGGTGGVISLANAFPALTNTLYLATVNKEYEKAIALNSRILQLNKTVSGKGGVAAVKYAMSLAGLAGGDPRLPLLPLAEDIKEQIKGKLKAENLI
ncbi:MAG: dihydrodipicolinate synthase family protein [Peptococcaceae bacterium]|jgi:4-hydroxy-2-oxoglutarate aldolase|nr:dihydrodipicolinate synthase family protein [Peptococcaceae bacterium]